MTVELDTGPVVVGTDGSPTAAKAVEEAARLASALGAELHIVYAVAAAGGTVVAPAPMLVAAVVDAPTDAEADEVLTRASQAVARDGLQIREHTLVGDPHDVLIAVAEQIDAQMIVVGNRGMRGLQRVFGSVPNSVSHAAHRTVLIVATT